ncbi:MAG: DUF1573 domain-containing protein [Verrucomicrobiota bacterium]
MKAIVLAWFCVASVLSAGTLSFKKTEQEITAPADAQTVTADFEFTNSSPAPVNIEKYEASCSCMSVQIKDGKTRYEPGESGVVRASFDMGNFTGDTEKLVVLWLDGDVKTGKPSVSLLTRVHVPVLVELAPRTLLWDVGEKPETKRIKVTMRDSKPIKVLNISASNENFRYEFETQKEGWNYEIAITPVNTEKPVIGIFRIETDCDVKKQRVHQCFASIRKKPSVVPR